MPLSKLRNKHRPSEAGRILRSFNFEAIGTHWRITIEQYVPEGSLEKLLVSIQARIAEFDCHYSRFRDDSLVTAMASQAGTYRLPDDAEPLIDLYEQLYSLSGGRMTPLIGQLLSDAGYDRGYSLRPTELRAVPQWSEALAYTFPHLVVKQPMLLDVGAAGKGYLVDIISQLIEHAGITSFCVNAGGDILSRNASTNLANVGLEHPTQLDQVVGIVHLRNQSLCGSAGNRRTWASFNHLMDPLSQASPDHIRATWVVAGTTLLADGLATALFFTEVSKLSQAYDFEYALIRKDWSLEHSPNFPADFFTEPRDTHRP
jgi:thiamine biosynthesis lipoprotein